MGARTAILAAIFVVACGSFTQAGAATRCRPAGARLLAADHRVDVFALSGAVYGCDKRTGKRVRLGNARICVMTPCVNHAAAAGDLIAYGIERCGVDTCSSSVSVLRLPDDKQLHSYAAITGSIAPESFQSVNAIVVKSDGAVAWIATASSIISHGSRIEVHANKRLLDSGASIVRSSLRLHGSTLTWRDGSTERAAEPF
jgi:hypothetical protein